MAAGDFFVEVGDPGTATTLNSNYTAGDSTVTVVSTTNWPSTGKAVVFAIDTAQVVDGEEVQVDGSYNEFEGTVASATSISNVDWKRGAGDTNYTAGSLTRVYIPVSSERENRLVTGLIVDHDQDGTHNMTSPKVTTGINDSNGNELMRVTATGSAVNDITLANAATGNDPTITASGDDTNVGLEFVPKGTGKPKGFTNFYIGTISSSTMNSTGNKAITGVGFTPKMVQFMALPSASGSNATFAFGQMTASAQTTSSMTIDTSNNKGRYSSSSNCISYATPGSASATILATYVSMDSDGFTINVSTAASIEFAYLAFG